MLFFEHGIGRWLSRRTILAVLFFILNLSASVTLRSQPVWYQVSTPTTNTLRRSCFLDNLQGWAVGNSGTIIRTTDGGLHWTLQDSRIQSNITDVYMLNKSRGWALSIIQTDTSFGTIILSTADGGNNWNSALFDSAIINTVIFVDSLHGWLGGESGELLHTTDGGTSWYLADVEQSIASSMPVHRIKFLTPAMGFAVGGRSEMFGVVWSTVDSGNHWATTRVAENLFDIDWKDSLNFLCVGGGFDDGAGYARTENGGATWIYHYVGITGRAISLALRNHNEAWSMIENSIPSMVTTDSGSAWQGNTIKKGIYLYDVKFPDDRHGFAVGSGGTVMVYNGPALIPITGHWNLISIPNTVADLRKSVLFPTSITPAYTYGPSGYITKDTLSNGSGYWIKYSQAQEVLIPGSPIFTDTFTVRPGWNLIGSISFPVPVSAIGNPGAPLGSLFYSYNGGYKTADTLYPGRGYWVKADGEGKLILSMDSLSFKTKISEKTK